MHDLMPAVYIVSLLLIIASVEFVRRRKRRTYTDPSTRIDTDAVRVRVQRTPKGFKVDGMEIMDKDLHHALAWVLTVHFSGRVSVWSEDDKFYFEDSRKVRRRLLIDWV